MNFVFFFIITLLLPLTGQASVRVYDSALTSISASTNAVFNLYAIAPTGEGTTETAAGQVFVPFDFERPTAPSNDSNAYYFKLNNGALTYVLFGFNSQIGSADTATTSGEATLNQYYVTFPLKITSDSTNKYLSLAVKNGTSYIVIKTDATVRGGVTNQQVDFTFSPQNLCRYILSNSMTACNSFDQKAGVGSETSQTVTLYFYMTDVINANGTTINDLPTAKTDGLYFKFNMSSKTYNSSEISVSLNSLRVGDKRLLGEFSTSASIPSNEFKETLAYNVAAPCAPPRYVVNCAGSFFTNPVTQLQSGGFVLNNLTNGQSYTIAIGLADKFGFITELSDSLSGTPLEIEELLKKQACFILTAGFGEEHFITNYFRHFRDTVLVQSEAGRKFIHFYYSTAPKYALTIYKSEALRFIVRMIAYTLYYIFNYPLLLLIFLIIFSSLFFLNLRKNKI